MGGFLKFNRSFLFYPFLGLFFLFNSNAFAEGFFSKQFKLINEYWAPKVESQVGLMQEYWTPRYERTRDNFHVNVHPKIVNFYESLKLDEVLFPDDVALILEETYNSTVSDIKNYTDYAKVYWKNKYPKKFNYLENLPASIKIAFDMMESKALLTLGEKGHIDGLERFPAEIATHAQGIVDMFKVSHDAEIQYRIEVALNRVAPYSIDQNMSDCYRPILLLGSEENAFNTGCTIFVTEGLVKKLNDDQLAAVLAHEVAHGDRGHLVKNFALATGVGVKHIMQLAFEESAWFFSGKVGPLFEQVMKEGNLPPFIFAYSKMAPDVELEADSYGALILDRAGISRQHLKDALIVLHDLNPQDVIASDDQTYSGVFRDYPNLFQRLKAIDEVEMPDFLK